MPLSLCLCLCLVLAACSDSESESPANPPGAQDPGAPPSTPPNGPGGPNPIQPGAGNTPITPLAPPTVAWSTSYQVFDSSVTAVAVQGNEVLAVGRWDDSKDPFTGTPVTPKLMYAVPWIAKFKLDDGKLIWSKTYPQAVWNGGGFSKLAFMPDGSFYLLGRTATPTLTATLDGVTVTGHFVTKFDTNGVAVWSRTFDAAPGSATKPEVFLRELAADENGVWIAAGVQGSARMDATPIAGLAPTTTTECALLHLGADGALVANDSFVATSGGNSFLMFALGRGSNGDLYISGVPASKTLTVGGQSLDVKINGLFASFVYWAAFAKGSKTARWATGSSFGDRVEVSFSPSGPSVLATTFEKSIALGGGNFSGAGGGYAAALISSSDGNLSNGVGYAVTTSGLTHISIPSISSTNGAYAFVGDSRSTTAPVDFGSGPLQNFIAWFDDNKALHAFEAPSESRMAFDPNKNLIVLTNAGSSENKLASVTLKSGFALVKLTR